MSSHLGNSWDEKLEGEFSQEYFKEIRKFLVEEYKNFRVYPPMKEILSAFEHTPYENVKVVILGQDPYHGYGQAHGMSFSVRKGVKCPPSLVNIYKALEYDLGIPQSSCGDLTGWADEGVLLLNTVLTVREGKPQSHANIGWEKFTDNVIKMINDSPYPTVFMLWGNPAKAKAKLIDESKHLVLKCVHPSPLSFHNGFLECKHFSKANDFLSKHGRTPIDWSRRGE